MMNKEKTQSVHKMKWLFLVPVAALILLSFNVKRAVATNVNFAVISEMIEPEPLVDAGDIVAETPVPESDSVIVSYGKKKETVAGKEKNVDDTLRFPKKNNPLVIIDGKEVNTKSLPPANEIESLSILKNDAAIKQYGEKGKNGVIIINKTSKDTLVLYADSLNFIASHDLNVRPVDENIFSPNENEAMVIIDGKESNQNELTKLEHNEIESISVLKNDAAIKYYGEKGKNGVIIVDLKKD